MEKQLGLKKLLWIDGIAALLAGIILLVFSDRLSTFFILPEKVLNAQGIIALVYSTYSINLARRQSNSQRLLYLLVFANAAYTILAVCLLLYFFKTASMYGVLYFMAEILFIGLLAFFEWRKIK
jgi:hypothetical protein